MTRDVEYVLETQSDGSGDRRLVARLGNGGDRWVIVEQTKLPSFGWKDTVTRSVTGSLAARYGRAER